jgi:ParB/RepB/Spo0J family partition protein
MTASESSTMTVQQIPLAEIYCDEHFNCRGSIAPIDVVDLARSISDNGLQQPIVVQPWENQPGKRYRIVSGHRRYTACNVLGHQSIPAIVKTDLNELMARKLNLEENLKRANLNILQEATALKPFSEAGWSPDMMSSQFGMSRGWVQARMRLLKLPEEIQKEAAAGFLTQEHITQLSQIKDKTKQFEAVQRIKHSKNLGEKKKIDVAPKKINPLRKKKREPHEIFQLQELFMDAVGPDFWSRCMAWCAGEISTLDLMKDFKDYAAKQGKNWSIPREIMDSVVSGLVK